MDSFFLGGGHDGGGVHEEKQFEAPEAFQTFLENFLWIIFNACLQVNAVNLPQLVANWKWLIDEATGKLSVPLQWKQNTPNSPASPENV